MSAKIELADDNGCFVCGKLNPIGLKLEFAREGDEYVTYFTPRKEHQGYVGIVHGGLVSTILDEVMVRDAWDRGLNVVTAEITVRFKRPAEISRRLRFGAKIESESARLIGCSARATDPDGMLIAEASGRLMRIS